MKPLLLSLFLIPICLLAQQPDTSGQHRLIRGLVDYRNELIARNPEGFKKLYLLDTLWKVEDKEEVQGLFAAMAYAKKIEGYSAHEIDGMVQTMSKLSKAKKPEIVSILNEELIQTIMDNDELALLIGQGIYRQKPPFLIDPNNTLYEELSIYKIQNGMKVAEIGAGDGTFSLMLGIAYDSLGIYVNDIGDNAIEVSWDRLENCHSAQKHNQFVMVQGNKKSTNMEEVRLDKVIIRNSFHHFSKKKQMLASIKKSLLPDGDLYIADPNKQPGVKGICPEALPCGEIRRVLEENGFRIVEERNLKNSDWVMLHCKPI